MSVFLILVENIFAKRYELLGVCQFLLNNPKADWEKNMERACNTFAASQWSLYESRAGQLVRKR